MAGADAGWARVAMATQASKPAPRSTRPVGTAVRNRKAERAPAEWPAFWRGPCVGMRVGLGPLKRGLDSTSGPRKRQDYQRRSPVLAECESAHGFDSGAHPFAPSSRVPPTRRIVMTSRRPRHSFLAAMLLAATALLATPAGAAMFVYDCILSPQQETPTPITGSSASG